jgi:hypothetical protein
MKRDKLTAEEAGIEFEITDTVLTEIDTQLTKMAEAATEDLDEFDGLDFSMALDQDET